ncbi:MAG TPA: hypothetical protein VGM51_04430 [Armatimonadota bacterium]
MNEFSYLKAAKRRRRTVAWAFLVPTTFATIALMLGVNVQIRFREEYYYHDPLYAPFTPPARPLDPTSDLNEPWRTLFSSAPTIEHRG